MASLFPGAKDSRQGTFHLSLSPSLAPVQYEAFLKFPTPAEIFALSIQICENR